MPLWRRNRGENQVDVFHMLKQRAMLPLNMELNHFFEGTFLKEAALGGIEPLPAILTPRPKKGFTCNKKVDLWAKLRIT